MRSLKIMAIAALSFAFVGCGHEYVRFIVANECDESVTVECRYKQNLLPDDSLIVHEVYDLPNQLEPVPKWALVYYDIPSEAGRATVSPAEYAGKVVIHSNAISQEVEPGKETSVLVKRKYMLNKRNKKMIAKSIGAISVAVGGDTIVYTEYNDIERLLWGCYRYESDILLKVDEEIRQQLF